MTPLGLRVECWTSAWPCRVKENLVLPLACFFRATWVCLFPHSPLRRPTPEADWSAFACCSSAAGTCHVAAVQTNAGLRLYCICKPSYQLCFLHRSPGEYPTVLALRLSPASLAVKALLRRGRGGKSAPWWWFPNLYYSVLAHVTGQPAWGETPLESYSCSVWRS